jgi:hypothetical protein
MRALHAIDPLFRLLGDSGGAAPWHRTDDTEADDKPETAATDLHRSAIGPPVIIRAVSTAVNRLFMSHPVRWSGRGRLPPTP